MCAWGSLQWLVEGDGTRHEISHGVAGRARCWAAHVDWEGRAESCEEKKHSARVTEGGVHGALDAR